MIKVLLAEDLHMVRGALAALLELERDIEVVSEVATGNDVLAAVKSSKPDIAIIDIDLPGKDGLTAANEIRASSVPCRTLILTSLNRPGTVRRALDAHVNGYMLKDASPDKLADALRQISVGRRVIDSDLALAAWGATDCPLTDREIDVLRHAATGAGVPGIAAHAFLSPGTVRNYLTNAVAKLNARNRVDAIRIATESGWL